MSLHRQQQAAGPDTGHNVWWYSRVLLLLTCMLSSHCYCLTYQVVREGVGITIIISRYVRRTPAARWQDMWLVRSDRMTPLVQNCRDNAGTSCAVARAALECHGKVCRQGVCRRWLSPIAGALKSMYGHVLLCSSKALSSALAPKFSSL